MISNRPVRRSAISPTPSAETEQSSGNGGARGSRAATSTGRASVPGQGQQEADPRFLRRADFVILLRKHRQGAAPAAASCSAASGTPCSRSQFAATSGAGGAIRTGHSASVMVGSTSINVIARQHEHRARRRLFEHFQQRVAAGASGLRQARQHHAHTGAVRRNSDQSPDRTPPLRS